MRVPIPMSLSTKISNDAVRNARLEMRGYGWSDRSLQAIQAMPGVGQVGIKTTLKFLMYHERGTKPFLMFWVQGRTIPMNGGFRRGGHVGEPGWVNIPGRGKVWRDKRWQHPGLQSRNFMQRGLEQAITDNREAIQRYARSLLGGPR